MIRVVVIDDSPIATELIKGVLERDPEIKVIAAGKNGREAIELVRTLKPDIVTMDLLMPVMNGFEAIEYLMAYDPLPILVVTGCPVGRDAELAFKALRLGALDVNEKPEKTALHKTTRRASDLVRNVKTLSRVHVITHLRGRRVMPAVAKEPPAETEDSKKLVVIASSTGGPPALEKVFSSLPPRFPAPVVVVQHIAEGFTDKLIEWLGKSSKLPVVQAKHNQVLETGTVSLIPDGHHGVIRRNRTVALNTDPAIDGVRPCADLLFKSAARAHGGDVVAVVMTGMGHDGVEGARAVKLFGGTVIAQDRKSSAIFGMPKAVIQAGCADKVVPLDEIPRELVNTVSASKQEQPTDLHKRPGSQPPSEAAS